jgi:hypothetical protein
MAAYFFHDGECTHIISNSMSIVSAGFMMHMEYYDKHGNSLTYYRHPNGAILARITSRRRQPVHKFFRSGTEANEDFKRMNAGLTFQTGKWVKKKSNNYWG